MPSSSGAGGLVTVHFYMFPILQTTYDWGWLDSRGGQIAPSDIAWGLGSKCWVQALFSWASGKRNLSVIIITIIIIIEYYYY